MAKEINALPPFDIEQFRNKVAENARLQMMLQRKLLPPQVLDNKRLEEARAKAGKDIIAPSSAGLVGHWVQPNEKDTDFEIRRQLAEHSRAPGDTRDGLEIAMSDANLITPFGRLEISAQELIEYVKEKQDEFNHFRELQIAANSIDPYNPKSYLDALQRFPELKNEPARYATEQMAMQEALRVLIRNGSLHTREDHALISYLVRDDSTLPIYPMLTSIDLVYNDPYLKQLVDASQEKFVREGLFSPRHWGLSVGALRDNRVRELQRTAKRFLLRRLYPGLENAKDEELDQFIFRQSHIIPGNRPMTNMAYMFWRYLGKPDSLYQWTQPTTPNQPPMSFTDFFIKYLE